MSEVTEVVDIWRDILKYNTMVLCADGGTLGLVNLTTNKLVATAGTPSALLDRYFAQQLRDHEKAGSPRIEI